ncbi:MAG: hypothetical protein PHQ43_04895 [Dehalococcoidales bacterium]|nr:hypothetical protein [Dehalococcoidales bacterium]
MPITEGDKFATQIAGESTSGGPKRLAVDDDGKVITSSESQIGHNISAIADNRKVVAAAGTAEALAASTPCKYVVIVAEDDNSGVVVVGGSTVVAASATRRGVPLNAGERIGFPIDDLGKVYIDSTVNGDGVTFMYLN